MRAFVVLVIGLASQAACLRQTEYMCTTDTQCGATGAICEPSGYCSFEDPNCASGRRYGELSGPEAGRCVGPGDGGVVDMKIDTGAGCPATYMQLGLSAHRYRLLSTAAAWSTHAAACMADGARVYLAVPTDQQELSALVNAAGGAPRVWLGIDDQATEATYVEANGGTLAANDPMWDVAAGEPNNMPLIGSGQGDCVVGSMANAKLADDSCAKTYPAICECEP